MRRYTIGNFLRRLVTSTERVKGNRMTIFQLRVMLNRTRENVRTIANIILISRRIKRNTLGVRNDINNRETTYTISLSTRVMDVNRVKSLLSLNSTTTITSVKLDRLGRVLLRMLYVLPTEMRALTIYSKRKTMLNGMFRNLNNKHIKLLGDRSIVLFYRLYRLRDSRYV